MKRGIKTYHIDGIDLTLEGSGGKVSCRLTPDSFPDTLRIFSERFIDRGFELSKYQVTLSNDRSMWGVHGSMLFAKGRFEADIFFTGQSGTPEEAINRALSYPRMNLISNAEGRLTRAQAHREALTAIKELGPMMGSDFSSVIVASDINHVFEAIDLAVQIDQNGLLRKGYECTKCGHCCLKLDGAIDVTADPDDIKRWKSEGREDILLWAKPEYAGKYLIGHYLWISPHTGDYINRCPWLRKLPGKNQYKCLIQDTKPSHCRRFPRNVGHAEKSGCPGYRNADKFMEPME